MKIVNTVTGETIAEILTNHSMTIDEALDLVGEPYEREYDDDPDYIVNGKEVWIEECTMGW